MPGSGPHRLYFVDRPPVVFTALAILLFVNTFSFLGLDFLGQYIFPPASAGLPACPAFTMSKVALHVPAMICVYAKWNITIQFVLLGLMAITALIFRKRVRYEYRGRRLS